MDWLRALAFLLFTALFLLFWAGGWMLAADALDLNRRERLPAGLGVGLLLFIVSSSLWGYILPVPAAFWAGSLTVFAAGLAIALRRQGRPILDRRDLGVWPLLLALLALTLLFTLINRGLAIFDDYHNLPLVSTLAAGNLPPVYFLNTSERLAYHFGLHLFSASLVRVGDLTPWDAYDLGKALSLALASVLAWVWFRRATRSRKAAGLGAVLATLGGGSRWLLLLVPPAWLEKISAGLTLLGSAAQSGPDLASSLRGPWAIDGDGPVPFPFAFANGIFPPQVMALGGSAALPVMTLFLLLLIARQSRATRRRWTVPAGAVAGLLLGSLALTAEHIFVLLWGGILLSTIIGALRRPDKTQIIRWGLLLAVSAVTAAAAGGVITEILHRQLRLLSGGTVSSSPGFTGFAMRWPPGLLSAHLGSLDLADRGHLLVGLAEIGIALALGPWVSLWCWKRLKQGDWMVAGLGAAAAAGFIIPLFVDYLERERDIVRLMAAALFIWMVLGFPLGWFTWQRGGAARRALLGLGYTAIVLGGAVMLGVQLLSIPRPQPPAFVRELDAQMSRDLWNELDPGGQIIDNVPHRAVTLFGRGGGRAQSDLYTRFPEWTEMIAAPDPAAIAGAGYTYIYMDRRWWEAISEAQQSRFLHPCVRVVAERSAADGDFRRLLDVRSCREDSG